MTRRKEVTALVVGAVCVILFLGFMFLDIGWDTAPVDRVDAQNSGANAPLETLPPADGAQAGSAGTPTTQK